MGELARQAGLSAFHFQKLFRAAMGVTPRAYAAAQRARRLQTALTEPGSVTDASYAAGFSSSGRFYEAAGGVLGMTPTSYKDGGSREVIRFAVVPCWLGLVLVAATARGVCAITLGDEAEALTSDLRSRFPKATLVEPDAEFQEWVAHVIDLIDAPRGRLALPLDIAGTAFQRQVWEALRAIPAGHTASYATIANAIGQPRAVRAVAQACAGNPVAVAVPCHRVVRQSGDLSGYRWGVDRKRKLLAREAEGAPSPSD